MVLLLEEMCGICAYIGYRSGFCAGLEGLKMLENRGYDGCGICSIDKHNNFVVNKYAKKDNLSAVDTLATHKEDHHGNSMLICHTRWSTHGPKTQINSHPHVCYRNKFSIVHNGIIENYAILKAELIKEGIIFNSQTDTEVIVNLISKYHEEGMAIQEAINKGISRLEGTWGIVLLCNETPNIMYCARHGSPLLVGFGDNFVMIASEQVGFCRYVNNYICLNNHDLVTLEKINGHVKFTSNTTDFEKYNICKVTQKDIELTPDPYPYWTIKEIYEQPDATLRAMGMGSRFASDTEVHLGGLESHRDNLLKIENLIILGCGTSYNAGLYSTYTFKEISGFNTVQIFDGSEFTKYDIPKTGKTGLLILSQSGETKDLHRAVELGRDLGLYMIGVINVVDSLIAREVQCGVYLNAGREVGVASTKAFTSQVVVLHMIAVWFSQYRNSLNAKRSRIIESLRSLPMMIQMTLNDVVNIIKDLSNNLYETQSMFVLGKGSSEPIAKEGSLKIKELTYIHSEAYSSSSLKHGPYSVLNHNIPVIVLAPNDIHFNKNMGIVEELLGRDAKIIIISDTSVPEHFKDNTVWIKIQSSSYFTPLLSIIPMQLLAYENALLRGNDVDRPKHISKTISVD